MLFRMLYDQKLAQASYLIGCQRCSEAIVIDPQRDVNRYIELAKHWGRFRNPQLVTKNASTPPSMQQTMNRSSLYPFCMDSRNSRIILHV